jgi:CRP/FNR family cyclic AMP-dependent transcriptional regulator
MRQPPAAGSLSLCRSEVGLGSSSREAQQSLDPDYMQVRYASAMPTRTELLANVPLFAKLDVAALQALAERVEELHSPAQTMIFHAGDPGDALFIVIEGEVEIFVINPTGERIVMECARAGHFFGEISLLDSGPRSASAQVTTALHALVVDRGDLAEFLAACPTAALDLMAAMGHRLRETARLLRGSASRNVNIETQDRRKRVQRAADWISDFSGSLPFLFIHVAGFALWIGLNVEPLAHTAIGGWDLYPFGLLTMSVSLEAIFLSVFVLLSQNRQAARDRLRNDIEYEINLKAELEIGQLHVKVDRMHEQLTQRLANLERTGHGQTRS